MKKNIKIITIYILIQACIGITHIEAQLINDEDFKTKIDTYLHKSVKNGFSGAVLVAVKDDIVLSKGYGWSDRDKKIPNTSSSVFNIGSVTKQFTAAAILKLVEDGKLKTSDKISKFFKNVPDDKKNITIHQLLTHTSGIVPSTGGFRYDEASKEQFLKEFLASDLQSEPGEKHQYANANYIMLAAIIELVSQKDYTEFLYENLWKSSNMTYTGYKRINFNSEQLAHGYYFDITESKWQDWGTTQEHLPYTNNHWYSIGKGDIYSTVEDLYKWHLVLRSNKVLSDKSVEIMETPYVAENEEGTSHYAYGWAIFKSRHGTKIVTHNGSNGIYFANFIRFVDDDVVVIVLSNVILGQDSQDIAWEISRMVFDKEYNAKPVAKLSYELVFDFMKTNKQENSEALIPFLEKHLGEKFNDKSVFNRIGFKMLQKEEYPAWGLELLKLNVQMFPDDGNLWDSLGEAYFIYEQKEKAIKCFSKALELKPTNNCYWCENSKKRLKELLEEN